MMPSMNCSVKKSVLPRRAKMHAVIARASGMTIQTKDGLYQTKMLHKHCGEVAQHFAAALAAGQRDEARGAGLYNICDEKRTRAPHKEKGRRLSDALSSRFRGKSGAHPNPVRIQVRSSASVKRTRFRIRLHSLDLSGALLGSWLPAFAFRHVRNFASFRSAPPLPMLPLALPPDFDVARRFAAGPLLTAIPVPRLRTAFRLYVRGRTAQVRPSRRKLTFVSLRLRASERCTWPASVLVPPVQPAARQTRRFVDRAAEHDQNTNLLTSVESFFSTIFRKKFWGKTAQRISNTCQVFLKITDKLFAGISTTASSVREFFCANGVISCSRSRTPQRASRDLRLSSNAALEGAL